MSWSRAGIGTQSLEPARHSFYPCATSQPPCKFHLPHFTGKTAEACRHTPFLPCAVIPEPLRDRLALTTEVQGRVGRLYSLPSQCGCLVSSQGPLIFPRVVFPARFSETGPLLGVPGSHWLLQRGGWAGGWGFCGRYTCSDDVCCQGPPPSLLLAKLKFSNCCSVLHLHPIPRGVLVVLVPPGSLCFLGLWLWEGRTPRGRDRQPSQIRT